MEKKVEIPENALVLMVGIAGAGKSTLAKKVFDKNSLIVSSDECRKEISGDELDQSVTEEAFELFYSKIRTGLKEGKRVVADATNLSYLARTTLYKIANEHEVPVYALILNVPLEVAKRQNRSREKVIEEYVLERHFRLMQKVYSEIGEELPKGHIIDIVVPIRENNRSEDRETRQKDGDTEGVNRRIRRKDNENDR